MGTRIISDLFVSYTDGDGVIQNGQRDEIVDLTAGDEKRLDALGALAPKAKAETPVAPAINLTEASPEELDAWVKAAKPPTVLAAGADAGNAAKLLESEQRQASPRKGLVEGLTAIIDKATA